MFLLNGQPLSPDIPFTAADGTQYPAGFIRTATSEQREALGITEVPDPAPYDQRFYWGHDNPKDHSQLVDQWVATTKVTAGTLLAPTDWMVIRQGETGDDTPQDVLDRRAEIRDLSNGKEAAIRATGSTDELAAYLTSEVYHNWGVST